jgi:hypothetical protein
VPIKGYASYKPVTNTAAISNGLKQPVTDRALISNELYKPVTDRFDIFNGFF